MAELTKINEEQNKDVSFSISYDGEGTSYEDHQIPVNSMISILKSINGLITTSNNILSDRSKDDLPIVSVSAPLRAGSAILDLIVSCGDAEQIKQILGYIGIIAPPVAFTGGTLLGLIKKFGNEQPTTIEQNKDGTVTVTNEDGEYIKTNKEVSELLSNSQIRKDLEYLIHNPSSGQASVKFIENGQVVSSVASGETDKFKAKITKNPPTDIKIENKIIRFVKINLEGESGWTFKINDSDKQSFSVKMLDKAFNSNVMDAAQQFDAKQLFEVSLQTTTTNVDGDLKKQYAILSVIKPIG